MWGIKMKQNPKTVGTDIVDCRPQIGKCPLDCNQCYYNRDAGKAYYTDVSVPNIPDSVDTKDKIVRMNAGHDSNLEKEKVLDVAKGYQDVFFNTSIPNIDFPGPVVFTANRDETIYLLSHSPELMSQQHTLSNIMFVRLRTSVRNIRMVRSLAADYILYRVPVVLTFMAYYDKPGWMDAEDAFGTMVKEYEYKTRHINSYWCPTPKAKKYMYDEVLKGTGPQLLFTCGTFTSNYCRDCRLCEAFYWSTKQRMENNKCMKKNL
jgi:hypothetical protein